MKRFARTFARLILAGQRSYTRKWTFLGVSLCVFVASVAALGSLDLLPSAPSAPAVVASAADDVEELAPELPEEISISAIGLSTKVVNPTSTTIAELDAALLTGAVRYPTSAKLGEDGNVVLFGHSSYLPVVHNSAYKAFVDIQKLSAGDIVKVSSAGRVYEYAVRSVSKEDAETAVIPLSVSGRVLTLATCNSFGEKSDRFIVVADFVGSEVISG